MILRHTSVCIYRRYYQQLILYNHKKLLSVVRCLLTFKSTFNFPFSIYQNPSRFIVTVGINNIPPTMISSKMNFQTHLNHF